ncbi:uncharacterized protein LOC101241713 [Hydra vulgaris]|uniref:uncharacterized protein LOC101241713 n=1 Tax=Hydra vulgaris TaxID=6087 RepID=UPI001F5FA162|nr:uncharacterized protein LOC101241713 isoform X1 [Hydra vulgaris]
MASFVYQRSYPRWKEPFNFKNENAHSTQQNKLQKQMSLSKEYGSAIISRDLAKEDMLVSTSTVKVENDNESTNLDDIKSLWGIKLRHVVVKDNQSSSNSNEVDSLFDFGYSKSPTENDSGGFVKKVKKLDRSISLDYLAKDSNYVNKKNNISLNNQKSYEILSDVIKPEKKPKIRRTKSLFMQTISNQIFYQPVDTEVFVKKPVLNLEELLMKDEKKLRGTVYNEQISNDIPEEKMNLLNISKPEIVKSPISKEKTISENVQLNKVSNFDIKSKDKILISSKEKKNPEVIHYPISTNQFATSTELVSSKDSKSIKNQQPDVKILKKMSLQPSINYSPISVVKTDVIPDFKKNIVFNKTDANPASEFKKKSTVSNETDASTAPELKKNIVFNKLGQVIVNDYDAKEPKVSNIDMKDVLPKESLDSTLSVGNSKEMANSNQSTTVNTKVDNSSYVSSNQSSGVKVYQEDDHKINKHSEEKIPISSSIFYENNNIASTNFNSYSSLKIIDSKISKSIETNIKENPSNVVIERINDISKKENFTQKPYLAFDLNPNNQRISRLTIIPGVDRDAQLEYGKYQIGVKNLNGSNNLQNFKVLIFTSNNLDEEFSEEELFVPKVVYNGVVEQIKSILLTNKLSGQKKKVVFAVKNLETIYSYPSEDPIEDFYTDSDVDILLAEENETNTSIFGIESAIQQERERLIKTYYENQVQEKVQPTLSTEGDHYQIHSVQEDGGVMLF